MDLIEKIVGTENETLLNQVKHLLEEEETKSLGNLNPALKASIKRGLAQANKGKVTPHNEVMKHLKKKLGNGILCSDIKEMINKYICKQRFGSIDFD